MNALWTAFENSPPGVFVLRVDQSGDNGNSNTIFCLETMNPAFAKQFGITMHDLKVFNHGHATAGQPSHSPQLPGTVADVTDSYARKCLDRKQSISFFLTPGLERSPTLTITLIPVVQSDGSVPQIVGICQDIETPLEESQQRLATLIDALPGIVFSCVNDGQWSMSYLSQGCLELTGYSSKDLVGKDRTVSYNSITFPEDLPAVLVAIDRAIERHEPYVIEYRILTRSGQEKWLWEKGHGIYDSRGEPIGLEGFITDITELKQAEAALGRAEAKYRSIFENAVEGIFQTTPDGRYLTANPMLAKIYGYDTPEELIATLTDISHQLYVDTSRRQAFIDLLQKEDAVWGFESQIYRKDGSIIWISENARTIRDPDGQLLGFEGTVEDITARKQSEDELRQRDNLLQGVAEATSHLLTDTDYDVAIAKALAILGTVVNVDRVYIYQNHPHPSTGEPAMSMRYEWVSQTVEPSIHQPHWQNQPYSAFGMTRWYETFLQGRSISGIVSQFPALEQELLGKDQILSILMVPILMDDRLWGYIGFDDCHAERLWSTSEESILLTMAASFGGAIKRQQAEATIRYQAFHDLLTGLPNRMLFNDRLPLALANANRYGNMLAVMFLDLDRFKTINDTLGHAVGDLLLQAVAQRLAGCMREGDTVARWGGDEFTLLLPQIQCAEDAAKTAQRIIDSLKPAFHLEGRELYISSSIGIALYPADGDDAQTLLKNADAALYRVKEQGRNGYQIYTPAINSKATELLTLESYLHHALERNEFVIHYQPQVNTRTWEVSRMEALVRWIHPELGFISPRTFIPLAEDNGLISAIGEWVLQTACAQNKAWQAAGIAPLRIAVNLSARQFQEAHLVETITRILSETQLEARYLELEITETTAMQNMDFTLSILKALHDMGIHISLDDFGTGYSSLGYLKKFPLHTLKIDQSFVKDLTTDTHDAAIVRTILALGQGLNLSVVAEGVETREQLEYLRSLNCYEMQGYLFSKPMTATEATDFLRNNRVAGCHNPFQGCEVP
jgi:diguanylate cyclase (GGDEF)-like protein/PAS domain S-box-containing protein